MLTKDLLKFRVRNGRVYPHFIPVADAQALAQADSFIDTAAQTIGLTVDEGEALLGDLVNAKQAETGAYRKLLMDRCEICEPAGAVEEKRWEWILASEAARRSTATIGEFKSKMEQRIGGSLDSASRELYADLPGERLIEDFKRLTPEELIHRHNSAQVQGLLIRAEKVIVVLKDLTLLERRHIFRALRFHRLLADIQEADRGAKLTLELSGPLSMFDAGSTYGINICNFIPHVFHLKAWTLAATVKLKDKLVDLKLDDKSGLVSHYREASGHVPEEFSLFVESFNARSDAWTASFEGSVINLGQEQYAFPDITLTAEDGRVVYLELFHKWYAPALEKRLAHLEKIGRDDLIVGVAKGLSSAPATAAVLKTSSWFAAHGFLFNDFPTPQSVLSCLATSPRSEQNRNRAKSKIRGEKAALRTSKKQPLAFKFS